MLTGRSRTETQRWLSFRAFYGFEAFYCPPSAEGAHEKGGAEGEIGRFRRRWLVPVPKAGSLAELNAALAEGPAVVAALAFPAAKTPAAPRAAAVPAAAPVRSIVRLEGPC